jgi:hypothetical protein
VLFLACLIFFLRRRPLRRSNGPKPLSHREHIAPGITEYADALIVEPFVLEMRKPECIPASSGEKLLGGATVADPSRILIRRQTCIADTAHGEVQQPDETLLSSLAPPAERNGNVGDRDGGDPRQAETQGIEVQPQSDTIEAVHSNTRWSPDEAIIATIVHRVVQLLPTSHTVEEPPPEYTTDST